MFVLGQGCLVRRVFITVDIIVDQHRHDESVVHRSKWFPVEEATAVLAPTPYA